jgi:P4 family phage/plasmid primase-like protien
MCVTQMTAKDPQSDDLGSTLLCPPDPAVAIDFLMRFSPSGPWVLTAIDPMNRGICTQTFFPDNLPELERWLVRYNGKRNIYFQVNSPMRRLTKKARRQDIKSVDYLHVDIDPRPGECLDQAKSRALGLLTNNLPEGIPRPSAVVFSGGGYQGFWKIDESIEINGEIDRAEDAKRWNQKLEQELEGDNCHNVDRIMRLPGTINLPNAKKVANGRVPEIACVVSFDESLVYSIDQFTPVPDDQSPNREKAESKAQPPIPVDQTVENFDDINTLDKWAVPDRIKVAIVQGKHPDHPKKKDNSRSAWLFDVVCQLVRNNVPDAVTFSVITNNRFGISESVLEQGSKSRKYALRQIKKAHQTIKAEPKVLHRNSPLVSANIFLRNRTNRLVNHNDEWFVYNGSAYALLEDQSIESDIYSFLDGATEPDTNGNLRPFNPNKSKVSNVHHALKSIAYVSRDLHPFPSWLEGEGPPSSEIIPCGNGLLHLPTRNLISPTSRFLTRNCLDFDFDEGAPVPAKFLRFLESLWPGDKETIDTLQQMFGYILTPDTSLQKIFLLVGPPRSGKGTIAHILSHLVGLNNICAPNLNNFGMGFGLEPLIGKQLAIVNDLRLGRKTDQAMIAENLLRISGEDSVTIDRKYKQAWIGQLKTRFLIMTNVLPSFVDVSGALPTRFVPLLMTQSFLGREDPKLLEDLLEELPGILNWAVVGWQKLQTQGRFSMPRSSIDALRDLTELASPISKFIDEECVLDDSSVTPKDNLYKAWCAWCETQGYKYPGTPAVFGRDLISAAQGQVKPYRKRVGNTKLQTYMGIRLCSDFTKPEVEPPF